MIKNLVILSLELLSICITTALKVYLHFSNMNFDFIVLCLSSAKMAIFLCTFSEQLTKLASLPSVIFINLAKENRPWTSHTDWLIDWFTCSSQVIEETWANDWLVHEPIEDCCVWICNYVSQQYFFHVVWCDPQTDLLEWYPLLKNSPKSKS